MMTIRCAKPRYSINVLGLILLLAGTVSAQSPEAVPDSVTFRLLTKGMTAELRERYREAISQDPAVREAIFGPSTPSGLHGAAGLGKQSAPPPAQALVKKDLESVVRRSDGAGVKVPAGALEKDLRITVAQPDAADESLRAREAEGSRLRPVSLPVEFGPSGTKFSVPVTITLAYDALQVARQGLSESALKIYYWNPATSEWEGLPSTVDKLNRTVSALTTHFSSYQTMGSGGGIGVAAADAALGFKAAYAFPNPLRGQGSVTFRVQPGLADSVEVRVYDLSGKKVHSSSDFRNIGAFDDGNGLGAQFTYEHGWDTSGIGSGVYTYVVVARKAGEQDISKTGKVALIK